METSHQLVLLFVSVLVSVVYGNDATGSTSQTPSSSSSSTPSQYPVGDVRNCPVTSPITGQPLYRMEVLPGLGFDNLRNYDMSQVVQYNYSLCKTTNDGRFLIPDDIITVPLQRSRLETYSDIYQHWDNYTSMTSASVNFDASVFSLVSGKFGFEYQHVKQHQVNDKAKTTRVQMRNTLYKVTLEPDAPLNPKFKNRLLDVAANIQSNNTEYAAFLTELLVRDYGTHIVRNVEAGALISQIDSISSQFVADHVSDKSSVSASASANFMGKFSFGISSGYSNGETTDTDYIKSRYHSQVISIGGPSVTVNMTLNKWEEGVLNSLVAIDREGDPLHYTLTSVTMPELPAPTLRELVDMVFYGVQMYYRVNTHLGCTDLASPNFDYEANLNDGSCSVPHTNFTFGGVYQTCEVDPNNNYEDLCAKGAATTNPLTGDYTCPSGYTAVELHSGTVTDTTKKQVCDEICHHSGFLGLSRSCHCMTAWVNVLSAADYQAYWCVAEGKVPDNTGYLFGGLYTSKSVNPVTKAMSCPAHFVPLHIGEELEVCVSDEYESAVGYAVAFGGFYSCKVGNPLASSKSSLTVKNCPKTYKHLLATVDEGCEINYCAKLSSDYAIKPPKRPPYHNPGLKVNITQAMVIQGPYGEIWVRDEQGNWVQANANEVTGEEVLQHLSGQSIPDTPSPLVDNNKGISAATSAVISSVATLIACTLIVLAVFGVYGIVKRRRSKMNVSSNPTTYSAINETDTAATDDTLHIMESQEHVT